MSDAFDGFPSAGLDFLAGLSKDNSKTYFDAHRAAYDDELIEPAKRFVEAMGEVLRERTGRSVHAEPRVNGSIFRLNRDVRFSADKTPYKDHLDFIFWEGDGKKRTCPSFYLRLAPGETILGAGMIGFDKKKLPAFRDAVADARGESLEAAAAEALENANDFGGAEIRGSHYKRVPRGYDAEHPRAELLMHAGMHARYTDTTPPAEQTAPAFVGWCADRWLALDPLQRWLVETFEF